MQLLNSTFKFQTIVEYLVKNKLTYCMLDLLTQERKLLPNGISYFQYRDCWWSQIYKKPDRKLYLKDFEAHYFLSSGFRHHLRCINHRFLPSQRLNKTTEHPRAVELNHGFSSKYLVFTMGLLSYETVRCKLIKIYQVIKLVGYHSQNYCWAHRIRKL